MESQVFGISVRAILAMFTVGTGLAFLYIAAFLLADAEILNVIIAAIVGFVNLSLGFYLGQKAAADGS
jgi:hypothetical protein